MPALRNRYQANGASTRNAAPSHTGLESGQHEFAAKKMHSIREQESTPRANGFSKTISNQCNGSTLGEETFQDTCALKAHLREQNNNLQPEEVLIYEGQSNTSIAQTAKDQFAAALLRLQHNLDESSRRLQAVESKVDDFIRQQQLKVQQQARAQQSASSSKIKNMGNIINQSVTVIYLGWPVVVFLAMRALERKSFASPAASVVVAASN